MYIYIYIHIYIYIYIYIYMCTWLLGSRTLGASVEPAGRPGSLSTSVACYYIILSYGIYYSNISYYCILCYMMLYYIISQSTIGLVCYISYHITQTITRPGSLSTSVACCAPRSAPRAAGGGRLATASSRRSNSRNLTCWVSRSQRHCLCSLQTALRKLKSSRGWACGVV